MVLIRRSSWTGEGAGMIDRPGGHAEPDEALKVIEEYNHELGEWFELNICLMLILYHILYTRYFG